MQIGGGDGDGRDGSLFLSSAEDEAEDAPAESVIVHHEGIGAQSASITSGSSVLSTPSPPPSPPGTLLSSPLGTTRRRHAAGTLPSIEVKVPQVINLDFFFKFKRWRKKRLD